MAELNEISEISSRFIEVINSLTDENGEKVKPYSLEHKYGIAKQAQITHIKSGRNKPSDEIIERLIDAFPEVNKAYILLGTPPVFKKTKLENSVINKQTVDDDSMVISKTIWNAFNMQIETINSQQKMLFSMQRFMEGFCKKCGYNKNSKDDFSI